ncbi:type 1 glutamine amidotransferase domain-containing protein [Mesorhizobium sp. M0220]|uniref:type 1 glutamine amidotransferase domain-containing protein n=1 Tax=unclassified Mesorhizobium TaxID=325217 RepID=UPI00333787E3
MTDLSNRHVLILSADGFEDDELYLPRQSLLDAGANVTLASPATGSISGVVYDMATGRSNPSEREIAPDLQLSDVDVAAYDALIVPGGVVNPDRLRMTEEAVQIVRQFDAAGKPVASICHGPWVLIEADIVRGRRTTGWYSVRTDLRNAGSQVLDAEVVIDGNLITSRMPSDIPAFTNAIVKALSG